MIMDIIVRLVMFNERELVTNGMYNPMKGKNIKNPNWLAVLTSLTLDEIITFNCMLNMDDNGTTTNKMKTMVQLG